MEKPTPPMYRRADGCAKCAHSDVDTLDSIAVQCTKYDKKVNLDWVCDDWVHYATNWPSQKEVKAEDQE